MIDLGEGNLLNAPADALVNTVNTVGVMGKGVPLQFKQAFPAKFKAYRIACARGEVQIGRMFLLGQRASGVTALHDQLPDEEALAGEVTRPRHRGRARRPRPPHR